MLKINLYVLDENKYCIEHIYDDNNQIVCYTSNILKSPTRQKLCEFLTFFVTPGIKFPPSSLLEEMIRSASGTVETINQPLSSIQKMSQNSYFIISCLEDLHLIDDKLKFNYGIILI